MKLIRLFAFFVAMLSPIMVKAEGTDSLDFHPFSMHVENFLNRNLSDYRHIVVACIVDAEAKNPVSVRFEVHRKATVTQTLYGSIKVGTQFNFYHYFELEREGDPLPSDIPIGNLAIVFMDNDDQVDEVMFIDTGDFIRYTDDFIDALTAAIKVQRRALTEAANQTP